MYQQQQMNAGQAQYIMPEEDMAYTVLSDLKRVVREYATAATESSCQQIRGMFSHLMNDTLHMQGELFKVMEQSNMYSTASPVLRQEIDKQLQQNQQTLQKTQQHLQKLGLGGQAGMGGSFNPSFMQNQQSQQQPFTQNQQQQPYMPQQHQPYMQSNQPQHQQASQQGSAQKQGQYYM